MCLLVLNVQKCALTRWPVQPLLLFLDLGLDLVSLLARSFLAPEEHACSCLSLLYGICTGSRTCRVGPVELGETQPSRDHLRWLDVEWTRLSSLRARQLPDDGGQPSSSYFSQIMQAGDR